MADDGDMTMALLPLVGFAFITTLDAVDAAGQLKPDSKSLDLALIMSFFLQWVPEDGASDGEDVPVSWRETIVGYVKKGNIVLAAVRPYVNKALLKKFKNVKPVKPAAKSKAADRWGSKKVVSMPT
jgi:hypothetical protein